MPIHKTINWSRVLAVGLAVYSVFVLVLVRRLGGGLAVNDVFFIPLLVGTVIGVFLTIKRPENRMGPLMVIMAAALNTLGASNVLVPMFYEQGNEALTVLAINLSDLAWLTQIVTALVLLPLWFPTGRPLDRRWAWVGKIAIGASAIAVLSFAFVDSLCAYDDPASEVCLPVENPWGIEGYVGFDGVFLIPMAMAIPAVVSAFVRWRRADDLERHQIKWFFIAAVVLLVATAVTFADINMAVNDIAFALGLTAVWVSIAVAVLKYRLYDIDRIISRTITYAVVVGLLAAAVAGIAAFTGAQFREPWVVAATTLAVAAVFNPLRKRVTVWVDRRFNRSRFDTEQVMEEFGSSLRDEVDPEEVVDGLLEVVDDTMQPAGIGVWIKDS